MPGFEIQYINSRVYEITLDEATGKTNSLFKQINTAIPVVGYQMYRRYDVCFNDLVKEMEEAYKDASEPLWVMRGFPLMDQPVGISADMDDRPIVTPDQITNYTVITGWCVETRRQDPHIPVIVKGDTSPEAISRARAEALTPYSVTRPFLLAFPESQRYMFEIRVSHVAEGAVTRWDSSKHEVAPDSDLEAMSLDPLAGTLSAEESKQRNQICEAIERVIQRGKSPADADLVVQEINDDWCQAPRDLFAVLDKYQIVLPPDNPVVHKEASEEEKAKLAIIQEVWDELMEKSKEDPDEKKRNAVWTKDILNELHNRGHHWFETIRELERFCKTYNPNAKEPMEIIKEIHEQEEKMKKEMTIESKSVDAPSGVTAEAVEGEAVVVEAEVTESTEASKTE